MNLAGALAIDGLGTILVLFILIYSFKKHPPIDESLECGCKLQCGYCKEVEASKNNFSITEKCNHPKQPIIKVLESSGTCETTVEVCVDCFEVLTEPKTDCR